MKDFFDLMSSRSSAREFEPYEATAEEIARIVDVARFAPSGKNSQPWKLFCLQGAALEELRSGLCRCFDEGVEASPEFNSALLPEYKRRAVELGKALFIHKGIARDDVEGRRRHGRANYELFNAPQLFVLAVNRNACIEATVMDCGIFLGYLTMAVEAAGFRSCPQLCPLDYPQVFREVLSKHVASDEFADVSLDNLRILCVLPFGKPLESSHTNEFRAGRLPAEQFYKLVK